MNWFKLFGLLAVCGSAYIFCPNQLAAEISHTPYIAYDVSPEEISMPQIGYRFQKNALIMDCNIGYKYFHMPIGSFHVATFGSNLFYSFCKKEYSQFYAGIGCYLQYVRNNRDFEWYSTKKNYSIAPTVSIGHDFSLDDSRKLFFELCYKPYFFSNNGNSQHHSTALKIGVGF